MMIYVQEGKRIFNLKSRRPHDLQSNALPLSYTPMTAAASLR